MNPDYEPDKLRIFHQDELQNKYTEAYMRKVMTNKTHVGEKFLSVTRNQVSNKGPRAWYEVLKHASQMLPKLFSTPRYREGIQPVERDYLKVDTLWVGCKVRMIWHMDVNGIQVADKMPLLPSTASLGATHRAVQQPPSVTDTEGVVQSIKLKRGTQCNDFYMKGVQTGRVYKVAPSQWY